MPFKQSAKLARLSSQLAAMKALLEANGIPMPVSPKRQKQVKPDNKLNLHVQAGMEGEATGSSSSSGEWKTVKPTVASMSQQQQKG